LGRICADPTVYLTDEGIIPMKTHRRIPHAIIQGRTDSPRRAARGLVILALVLGSLGADIAATTGHAGARQPSNVRRGTSPYLISASHITERPWMY
jgi:hypothetical protein